MNHYHPTVAESSHETEVKRSRFITYIAHTPDIPASQAFIEKINARHPKANHNCWARIAGPKEDIYCRHSSDDGEPKGTAGKPMLNVLEHSDLCEITVVVTRYFGGIKLGTGGLVRAYSQAVQDALTDLAVTEKVHTVSFTISLPHALINRVETLILQTQVQVKSRDWQLQQLTITGEGSPEQLKALRLNLSDIMHQLSYSDALRNA